MVRLSELELSVTVLLDKETERGIGLSMEGMWLAVERTTGFSVERETRLFGERGTRFSVERRTGLMAHTGAGAGLLVERVVGLAGSLVMEKKVSLLIVEPMFNNGNKEDVNLDASVGFIVGNAFFLEFLFFGVEVVEVIEATEVVDDFGLSEET